MSILSQVSGCVQSKPAYRFFDIRRYGKYTFSNSSFTGDGNSFETRSAASWPSSIARARSATWDTPAVSVNHPSLRPWCNKTHQTVDQHHGERHMSLLWAQSSGQRPKLVIHCVAWHSTVLGSQISPCLQSGARPC